MLRLPDFLGNWIGPIVGFLIGLIPLILVHEFGHLIMAKIMGVWAREFGIGYPPRIMKLFGWNETDFTLNWLPFGGFVRMEGESTFADPNDAKSEEARKHSLYSKTPWQRIAIFLGGPMTNILTAWLIAVLIFTTGIPQLQAVVSDVVPDSPAATANIQAGDALVAVNGEPVHGTEELRDEIGARAGESTSVTVVREGETFDVELVPRANPPENEGAIGVMIANQEIAGTLQRYSLGQSLVYGSRYFANVAVTMVMLPVYIVRLNIPFAQARPVGIVGISQIAQQSVNQSLEQNAAYPLLSTMLLLSISLGIFNLLPIPALDGGRILFSLIEGIRGKALSPELEERIHMIALMVMVVLFVAITVLDIVMPVQLQ
jgi:regulator of sigma E protease